jgi:hypothetical protein
MDLQIIGTALQGLAHLARAGFFKPVHVKSLRARALRSLIITTDGCGPAVRSRQCHADPLRRPAQAQGLGLRGREATDDAKGRCRSGSASRDHRIGDQEAPPEGGSRRRRRLCCGGRLLADCAFNLAALYPAHPIKCRTEHVENAGIPEASKPHNRPLWTFLPYAPGPVVPKQSPLTPALDILATYLIGPDYEGNG